ncbi:MAG: DNA polymerase III subunit delta [Gemmatimonadetes bacterium]|nr:DNA polymerase III subunit delta [Gemmatimonadota bacterium]
MSASADTRLARALDAGPPTGGWFLYGDAVRLRDEGAKALVEAALDPATRDFNFDQFRAEDVSGEQLASTLAMPPMMAERRVVTVRDAERLSPSARKVLQEASGALPEDVVLVVTATIPKGSRAAFYRELKSNCTAIEWSAPRTAEIPGWLRDRARRRWGVELSPRVAQAIAGAVGEDLSRLDAELEKLAGLGADEITLENVDALIPRTRRIDRWTWLDLVANRDYGAALRTLDDLLTSERGVGLVAGLVEHHLLLGLATGGGASVVRETLTRTGRGYLSWKADAYAKQARRWTAEAIERALRRMHRADRHLKSGGTDRGVLTELLLALERDRRAAP